MSKKENPVLQHLIDMESLDLKTIHYLFNRAEKFLTGCLAKNCLLKSLSGKIITNLFFEPSTRSRNSFIVAAERLGAIVLNPSMDALATVKGESLIDTIHTFESIGTSLFVIRHSHNNTASFVATELLTDAAVINAGDGDNQHPSQALLDLFTIQRHKPNFQQLKVAIIGDILHSRVARSLIRGLNIMGTASIRLIAPETLVPNDIGQLHVEVFPNLEKGLEDVDVVVTLRIQKERMQEALIPAPDKFYQEFGLTPASLAYAKPDAIVMHPGPINRNVEIASSVADGPQSVILEQVRNGVAMRMAIMDCLLNK